MVKLIIGLLLIFLAICWFGAGEMPKKPTAPSAFYERESHDRAERIRSVANEFESLTVGRNP